MVTAQGEPVEGLLAPGSLADVRALPMFDFDLPEGSPLYGDRAFTLYFLEDLRGEALSINFRPLRKKNSKRPGPACVAYLQAQGRKMVETAGSLITRLLPKSIHAVTSQGFELKVFLFVLQYVMGYMRYIGRNLGYLASFARGSSDMRMRVPMLMLPFFVSLGCSAQAQGPSELPESRVPVPMQRVFTEQYTGLDQSRRLVIRNPEQWQAVWGEVTRGRYPTTAPPAVDFNQSMVILAAMGTRNMGGHVISIEGVYRSGGRLFVAVLQVSPGSGCMTTQALTSPVDAVQVPKSDEAVTFVEQQETRNCE